MYYCYYYYKVADQFTIITIITIIIIWQGCPAEAHPPHHLRSGAPRMHPPPPPVLTALVGITALVPWVVAQSAALPARRGTVSGWVTYRRGRAGV